MSSMRISAVQALCSPPSATGAPDSSCHCRPTTWPGAGFVCVALLVKSAKGIVIGVGVVVSVSAADGKF